MNPRAKIYTLTNVKMSLKVHGNNVAFSKQCSTKIDGFKEFVEFPAGEGNPFGHSRQLDNLVSTLNRINKEIQISQSILLPKILIQ